MLSLRKLAQHDATANTGYGITRVSGTYVSHSGSQQAHTPTDTQPSSQSGKKARSRSRGRERRKNNREKTYDEANPAVAIEAVSLYRLRIVRKAYPDFNSSPPPPLWP